MADTTFIDTSTECAICLNPLDCLSDNNETITLSCGHRWHLACLKEQLASAQPSKSKRLIFSGCRCAKCSAFCDHPKLENLTRRTDSLREKVDELVVEQLKVDAPDAWRDATDSNVSSNSNGKAKLIEEGRRSYAFYLCGGCDEPYFGGTIECADEMNIAEGTGARRGELTTSEDRLCKSCSPKSQAICQKTFEHRPYHVWKCRYCCNPSTFVCYGNVHFCSSCHDKNPLSLEVIPCKGREKCSFPMPEGCDKHSNGSTLECEQVYYCVMCDSSSSLGAAAAAAEEEEIPGSRNLIVNPSGEEGSISTRGWQHPSNGRWKVEPMGIPVDDGITRFNYVSNFQRCVMTQTIPLHRYVRTPSSTSTNTALRIEISAKYMGRTDCPSVFRMEARVANIRRELIHQSSTSTLEAPAGFWEKATLTIDGVDMNVAHEVTMIVYGKDSRFWRGDYGSKVCHCSVRILGTEEELREIFLPEYINTQAQHERRSNYMYIRERIVDIFLPVLLIIFFWLISE
mmetsp:Transcript_23692/g.51169  ORF Transcript_23692/g.51169 Transcript_23692/m.51169 type:complete len:513 (+) Transcript_23692:838-2376(+)